MVRRSDLARVIALIVLGAGAAALSNLAASTERRLAWVGSYPRALVVGPPETPPTTAPAGEASRPAPGETAAVVSPHSTSGHPAPAPPVPESAAGAAAPDAGPEKSFPPHPDRPAVEITPSDTELLHRRNALFLDARRSSVYAEGHIAGARSFPVWESDIDARIKGLYEEGLDQGAPIVVYCSGGNCEDSHMLAEKLYMVGFDNVLIYKDGFPDWEKRGLAVTRGAKP